MAFEKITEEPSLYDNLEEKPVREILEEINDEDSKIVPAVRKTIPQIEKLVESIVPKMKRGGRIFYIGAGTSGRLGVLDASEIPPTYGMPPSFIIGLIAGGDFASLAFSWPCSANPNPNDRKHAQLHRPIASLRTQIKKRTWPAARSAFMFSGLEAYCFTGATRAARLPPRPIFQLK